MLFPACTTGNTMLIGVDAHSTALPPVPLNPHPFVGCLMLWTSPKFPMANVMINGSTACCVGAKSYSVHIPQGTWVDIPKVSFKVWYLTNLITVGIVTVFGILANIQLAIVQGLVASLTKPTDAAAKETWSKICGLFAPFTSWQTWAQLLIPPLPLPGAEGNCAIGSPTVSINGGSMALGVPLGGASCSEIPIVPNASVIAFSHVQVGMTFAQLVEAFFNNAVQGAINYAGSQVAKGYLDRNRCRLGLEPIDLVTGANFEDKVDFEIGGPFPLKWKRYYASSLELDGPLGWNWSHEYQRWLEFKSDSVVFHNEQNRSIVFPPIAVDAGSHYLPFERLRLTRVSNKTWQVTNADGITMVFARTEKSDQAWIGRLENRAGNALVFRYDPRGRLHEIVHSTSQRIIVENNDDGRLTRVALLTRAGQLQPLVSYSYDQAGDLAGVTDAAGQRAGYRYDNKHRMTRKTDRRGYSFHYAYDHNGRCIRSRGDDDLYMGEIEYIPPAKTTIMTGADGRKNIYRYDDRGLVVSILDPYGGVQIFEYDDAGNKVSELDPNGHAVKFAYDDLGNIVEETNPHGGTTKRKYNVFNLKAEETDPDGNTTKWLYDERGNLIGVIGPTESVTLHEYDLSNRLVSTTEPGGRVLRFLYNDYGQRVGQYNASGALLASWRYDEFGRIIEHREGKRRTRYEYNANGQLIRTEYPDGSVETSSYDTEGNLTGESDGRRRTWRYQIASWNKRVGAELPGGAWARYEFTRNDEMTVVTDGAGHTTILERDFKDRITRLTVDGHVLVRRIFDAGRNARDTYDGEGNILVRRQFGPGGFRILEAPADTSPAKFEADAMGRVINATRGEDEVRVEYDSHGSPVLLESPLGTISITRDNHGRIVGIEWSEGYKAILDHNPPGGGIDLQDPAEGMHHITGLGGDTVAHEFPNGLVEVKRLSPEGALLWHRVENRAKRQQRLILRQYETDTAGNRLREIDRLTGYRASFGYDEGDRLTSAEYSDGRVSRYCYDAASNLTVGDESGWSFGAGNRVEKAAGKTYEYDGRGCPRNINSQSGSRRLQYDGNGRLILVQTEDGRNVTFGYDALGRRRWKECEGHRTEYQYDEHRLLREVHGENNRRLYCYLGDSPAPFMFLELARGEDGGWVVEPFYVHADDLGVARAITDRTGQCVWRYEPDPYGEGRVESTTGIEFNLRFPGQCFDPETGWRYNGYRYYDPETGRFLEPDPIFLKGGMNIYAYPANPWRKTDPSGLNDDCTRTTPRPEDDEPEVRPGTPIKDFPPMQGRTYAEVTDMLRAAGYVEVRPPSTSRSPRSGNMEEVSGIWMMRDADGTTHAVRVDPWGHAESLGPAGLPPHMHRHSFPSGAEEGAPPLQTGGDGMTDNERAFLQPRNNVPTTNYLDDGTVPPPPPTRQEGESGPEFGRRMDEYMGPLHTPIDPTGAPPRPTDLPPHPHPEMLEPAGGTGGSSGGS